MGLFTRFGDVWTISLLQTPWNLVEPSTLNMNTILLVIILSLPTFAKYVSNIIIFFQMHRVVMFAVTFGHQSLGGRWKFQESRGKLWNFQEASSWHQVLTPLYHIELWTSSSSKPWWPNESCEKHCWKDNEHFCTSKAKLERETF